MNDELIAEIKRISELPGIVPECKELLDIARKIQEDHEKFRQHDPESKIHLHVFTP